MQIITGKYRARKLVAVEGDSTRPTLARVKESIFNLIQGKVQGSKVLDLFAGSGAFGAECISRSAEEVCFVDQEQKAINAIKTNTKKCQKILELLSQTIFRHCLSFQVKTKLLILFILTHHIKAILQLQPYKKYMS